MPRTARQYTEGGTGNKAIWRVYDAETEPADFIRRFEYAYRASLEGRALTPAELAEVQHLSEPQLRVAIEAAQEDLQMEYDGGGEAWSAEEGLSQEVAEGEPKTVENILEGAKETTRPIGKALNYEKSGDYQEALKDFDALGPIESKEIATSYGDGKYGVLKDGTTISVRPDSKTGGSTLEIHVPGKRLIKIRYI